jgi:hypothetical protein
MKILLSATIFALIIAAQANGEILNCDGSIVNSLNDFDKRITVHIDVAIPTDNDKEFILTLANKDNKQFESLLAHNPPVRKSFIELDSSLNQDKGGKKQQSERYEFIVTKMPDNNNSLYGFIYGYTGF